MRYIGIAFQPSFIGCPQGLATCLLAGATSTLALQHVQFMYRCG
jgi:hypothetical protein